MKKLSKHALSFFGIVCLIFAVVIITATAGASKRCTQPAVATVVEYRLNDDRDNSTSYFPVVQYIAGNKHIEAVSNSGSSKRPYDIGSEVKVRYNPDDAYEFVFDGDKSGRNWGIYMVVIGLGLILFDFYNAHSVNKAIVSRNENYNEDDDDDYSYSSHSHYTHHSGNGISIDIRSIAEAAKVAKKFKEATSELKKLSPDERKALYEALDENPEILLNQEGEEKE